VSPLPRFPREMSKKTQVLYKWVMPSAAEIRYAVEKGMGRAIDWSDANERNVLMFESAIPLAKMYSPLYQVDDTFCLQEYFVPDVEFKNWVALAAPITLKKYEHVTLLNTTIRFVEHDQTTMLPYAQVPGGSHAFVLYFRVHRNDSGDDQLHEIHRGLAGVTLSLGGTFYIPYRHHYTPEELQQGHPNISKFFERKAEFDPHGVFDSLWFREYGSPHFKEDMLSPGSTPSVDALIGRREAFEIPAVSEHRTDSYGKLLADAHLRQEFFEGFLGQIFNVGDNSTLPGMISRAVWDPDNKDDNDIYEDLCEQLSAGSGPVAGLTQAWRGVKQLRAQKVELVRETGAILGRLGRLNNVRDYVCIGDNGKTVLPFREELGLRGQVYVVHDIDQESMDIPHVLERGSVEPVGRFARIDFGNPVRFDLPTDCANLVTMNQGLHHLPPSKLPAFLAEVRRVLRPGGIFIVREHDCSEHLRPLLDLAHSVFNAVTGVSPKAERNEIRAFRPIAEWREIISAAGFVDSMIYEMEHGDPTLDQVIALWRRWVSADFLSFFL
jgi:SAM-dependent methyltransferase